MKTSETPNILRKMLPMVVISLWGVVELSLPKPINASIPMTKAVIQNLRNWVRLMPYNQPERPAQQSDAMTPGDGLSTGRASLAELRFNDGSFARVGEQALFQFLPRTRNFRLSNGTVLLLIPPGKGRTGVRTPNAAVTIRGSGLFVRYDERKDTTIVGALTNSGIEVFNRDASQNRELKAGQLIVIVKGTVQGLYEFDLRTFYETSDLVEGLNLRQTAQLQPDPEIATIQAEISAALASQLPITGTGILENPSFLRLSADTSDSSSNLNANENSLPKDNSPINSLQEAGQILSNTRNNNSTSQETVTDLNPSQPSNSGNSEQPPDTSTGSSPNQPSNPGNSEQPPDTSAGSNTNQLPNPGDSGQPPDSNTGSNPNQPSNPGNSGQPPDSNTGSNPNQPSNPGNSGHPPNPNEGREPPPITY